MSTPTRLPAIPPPPGHTAFGDDPTLWKWCVVCVAVCLSITSILIILRTYVRLFVRREWIAEDYMATLSWFGLVTYCALMTTVMRRHGGVHQWDLTKEEVQSAFYWFNMTSIEYGIEMLICKLTILMLYRRIFLPTRWSAFDIMLRTLEAVLVMFYFSITVVKIFECNPRARIWNRKLPGTCININNMLSTSGMFNFVTDVLILLVPIKAVWTLRMKRARKIRVVAIFTFGLIGPVFAMIGFLVREKISHSPDATYNQPLVLLWGTAEVSTGVIVICLPLLSILFTPKKRNKGLTTSILNGDSNKLNVASNNSRRKTQPASQINDDLLNADYYELNDGSAWTVGVEKPRPAHVVRIVGGSGSSENLDKDGERYPARSLSTDTTPVEEIQGQNIVKTVRIHQSYK